MVDNVNNHHLVVLDTYGNVIDHLQEEENDQQDLEKLSELGYEAGMRFSVSVPAQVCVPLSCLVVCNGQQLKIFRFM